MTKKEKVLVIVGPTAVGKTALSVDLAQQFDGEVISGDSMQVYRGLDIGTAKATKEEQLGIPHYLLDERDVTETFSVADFQRLSRQYISQISADGKLPIVVGGTGLYIQALLFEFQLGGEEPASQDLELRAELAQYGQTHGNLKLWERLAVQDEQAAAAIHPNNVKRVIRAIEVKETSGKSITEQPKSEFKDLASARYDVKLIGLTTEREALYQRINHRVELMLNSGLLQEAQQLYEGAPHSQAAQGIGYKEFFPYFAGRADLATVTEQVKQNSRRYAKRQLTWFRNRMTVEWWDLVVAPETQEMLMEEVQAWLES